MIRSLADFIAELNSDYLSHCAESLEGTGLSTAQITFLVYIGDHPNCSPTEMAKSIDADSGYTTRTVKKLIASGMATRECNRHDGRACVLRLTDEGMEKFREIQAMHRAWEARMLQQLDAEEREFLLRVMSKLL